MPTTLNAPRATVPRPPRFDHRRIMEGAGRLVIPSWVLSLIVHSVLILLMGQTLWRPAGFGQHTGTGDGPIAIISELNGGAAGLPGDGTGQPEGPGIGIFAGPAAAGDKTDGDTGTDDGPAADADATATVRRPANKDQQADDAPPVALDLPEAPLVATAGPGPAATTAKYTGANYTDARQMIRPTGSTRSQRGSDGSRSGDGSGGGGEVGGGGQGGSGGGRTGFGGGGGGTSFFGHKAVGRKFVYVLDASSSMHDYNAIGIAKAELLASLAQLDENQQFQVIFYNDKCHPMRDSDRKENLFWGTDTNRTRASQFVRNVEPDGGTNHIIALLEALKLAPDVIFFLTDAGEPILYAKDLDTIKRRNNGRSTIFTIEFGKGANLRIDNFLKQLARENGGAHAYRDVQEFQTKPDRRRGE